MPPVAGVEVTIGRKVRTLRFTNQALVRLEMKTGWTLQQMGERLSAGSFHAISALIWAGRLHAEPKLSLEEVIDEIDLARLTEVAAAASRALKEALGSPEDEEDGDEGEEDGGADEGKQVRRGKRR